jgi:hypothetical protein
VYEKIQIHLMQYVEKNSWEADYNMLVQNHVHYNHVVQKITLWGDGGMVNDLTTQCQCGGEEFKSPHLQLRLPWLLR